MDNCSLFEILQCNVTDQRHLGATKVQYNIFLNASKFLHCGNMITI